MNEEVIRKMCTTPFTVLTVGNVDSAGDRAPGVESPYHGYVLESSQTVINDLGQEEVSGIQIYVPGNLLSQIAKTSLVSVRAYTKKRIIKMSQFDGPNSSPEVGVIYLP